MRKPSPEMSECVGGLQIKLVYGPTKQTIRAMEIVSADYRRAMQDAQALDNIVSQELGNAIKSFKGSTDAPKL